MRPDAARRGSGGSHPRLAFALACLLYAATAFWALGAAWHAPDRLLPGSPVHDEPQHRQAARLEHLDQSMVVATVTANAATLVTRPWILPADPQCYPMPESHTLGEHMLGLGILAALPWALTHDPILSFNVALLLTLWIAGVAMYRLAWHFTGSVPAALVAGLLFEITPRRLADQTHPYIHGDLWTPLALLCLHRALARARWRDVVGFAAFTTLAMFESLYSLLGFALLLAVYVPYALVRHRASLVRALPRLTVAAAWILGVAWWLFGPYLATRHAWGLLGGRRALLYTPAQYLPGRVAFPGFLLLALVGIGLCDRLRRTRVVDGEDPRLAYVTAAVLLLGATIGTWSIPLIDVSLPSPLLALRNVLPGLDAVRSLPAIGIAAALPLTLIAGYGVLTLVESLPRRATTPLTIALVALALASTFHPAIAQRSHGVESLASLAWDARPADDDVELVRRTPDGAVLDVPFHTAGVHMLAAATDLLRASYGPRRSAACYNSFRSPVQVQIGSLAAALPAPSATEALHALGFVTVMVEHAPYAEQSIAAFENALAAQPAGQRGIVEIGRTPRLTAYQIVAHVPVERSFSLLQPDDAAGAPDATLPRDGGELLVTIRNPAAVTFRHPDPLLPSELVLQWLDASGRLVEEQPARALLPLAIGPRSSGTMRLVVTPPAPGRYELRGARRAAPEHTLFVQPVTATTELAPPPPRRRRPAKPVPADAPDRRPDGAGPSGGA